MLPQGVNGRFTHFPTSDYPTESVHQKQRSTQTPHMNSSLDHVVPNMTVPSDSEDDEPLSKRVKRGVSMEKALPREKATCPPCRASSPNVETPLGPAPEREMNTLPDNAESESDSEEYPEAKDAEQALEEYEAKQQGNNAPVYTGPEWAVEREKEKLQGAGDHDAFVARAYKFRDRAQKVFAREKDRLLTGLGGRVTAHQIKLLKDVKMTFDRGTRRRGVWKPKYNCIGLSARLVDGGFPVDQVVMTIRHELAHAATPIYVGHNHVWKCFNLSIGGDGQRCCTSQEAKAIIGHKVEIYCPVGGPTKGNGHFFHEKQKAPSQRWINNKICAKCKKEGVTSKFIWRRV